MFSGWASELLLDWWKGDRNTRHRNDGLAEEQDRVCAHSGAGRQTL